MTTFLPESGETLLRTAPWVQHTNLVDLPRLRSPRRGWHAQHSESEDDDQRECLAYDLLSERMAKRLHDLSRDLPKPNAGLSGRSVINASTRSAAA